MVDSPSTLVPDSSLLIDLHVGGILRQFITLQYSFTTPDVIIAQLQDLDGTTLMGYGLQQSELAGEQVREVVTLRGRYRRPSANDLFALVLARHLGATLLTSDRHLREAALQEQVVVHGTLWVLDELVRLEIVPAINAADALRLMLSRGSRLPSDESDWRLKLWSAGAGRQSPTG